MTERQLQFRVGLFVVLAMFVGAVLIIQFSELRSLWKETYALAIHFEEAPGIQPGSPVKQNGITIGAVQDVALDDTEGGVLVVVKILAEYRLRLDAQPSLSQSLFGDSKISFTSGKSSDVIPPNSRLNGIAAVDPMEIVQRLENTVNQSLGSFVETSHQWQLVGRNLNQLMQTQQGPLDEVIEQTAISLTTFNQTMQAATTTFAHAGRTLETASATLANINLLLADPQLQGDMRRTVAALPKIAEETELTIRTARASIQQVSRNLDTINAATAPLAEQSDVIVRKLAGSLIQLESLLGELNQFSQVLNSEQGSLQEFVSDPALYQNLSRSTLALNVLLQNLEPILRDARIFSDKIARHPELLGVSGAMRGSSGIKEPDGVQPAGYSRPGEQR